eukprot:TRINITY_DN22004_c0_g1_i1.p1 TRINITY_DN22004_c0_g1~~TRINITY_DN22004_c0_g1_i1.p1  ORF type:complete len:158 (-),score=22.65 TRINITY_DN22004_c0_g1_i1:104-577(-)
MAHLQSLTAKTEMLSHVLGLMEAFKAFDANNDGLISVAELGGLMGSLGYTVSEQEVTAIMRKADKDRDGLLSMEEFLEMNTKEMDVGDLATLLGTAFQELGMEGDEVVTADYLFEVMGSVGNGVTLEACQGIVAAVDGDGDGIVSVDDFKLILNALL